MAGKAKQSKKVEELPKGALCFREEIPVEIEESDALADGGGSKRQRKFSMVANSGGIILNHWFWGNLAIDMDGLVIGRQKKPALRDHSPQRIVGWTTKIEKSQDGGIRVLDGRFSETTEDGKEALALADEGFPWQASVYVPPVEIERVPAGSYSMVNGRKLQGPGTIFRKSRLREVSFTALGADENTDAQAFADDGNTVKAEFTEYAGGEKEAGGENEMDWSALTLSELREQRPDVADALVAEGRKSAEKLAGEQNAEVENQATERERMRVVEILKLGDTVQLPDLARKFVEEGLGIEDAKLKMAEERLSATRSDAPSAQGNNDPDGKKRLESMSFEERCKYEWENDPEIRAEFRAFKFYQSFKKAEARGRVKVFNK